MQVITKRKNGTRRVAIDFTNDVSMTKQSFKEECDINNILAKYKKTGLLDHVNNYQGDYTDVTSMGDYHQSQNMVIQANETFMSLPAEIRTQFANDPGQFLDFVENPDNKLAMEEMGLLKPSQKSKAAEPDPVKPDPETTPTKPKKEERRAPEK